MSHKGSCRACGSSLTPIAECKICNEYIGWVCSRCDRMEDVTHMHGELNEEIIVWKKRYHWWYQTPFFYG